jgi:hypothetical protein
MNEARRRREGYLLAGDFFDLLQKLDGDYASRATTIERQNAYASLLLTRLYMRKMQRVQHLLKLNEIESMSAYTCSRFFTR